MSASSSVRISRSVSAAIRCPESGSTRSDQPARYGIELALVSRPSCPQSANAIDSGHELSGGVVQLGVLRLVVQVDECVAQLVDEGDDSSVDRHSGVDADVPLTGQMAAVVARLHRLKRRP